MKISIHSVVERFRRAGLALTRTPIEVDTDDLTEAQIKALKDEPLVVVAKVEEPASKHDVSTAKGSAKAADAVTATAEVAAIQATSATAPSKPADDTSRTQTKATSKKA